ncbi:MAG: type III pantothenate kinase [Proteobacteria bacterium]|nr:type III pantothenate kinase [Pseudomonadota bacterium]
MSIISPVDALMAIDMGNTRIGMAVWDADGVHHPRHVNLDKPDTWKSALEATWGATDAGRTRGVVVASVVRTQTDRLRQLAGNISGIEPVGVGDDIPLPMPLDIDHPDEIGVDRVCSAAAAYDRVKQACAVASFGSAITIDCVSAEGHFLGGAILPGFEMAYDALHNRADALPKVEAAEPKGAFGRLIYATPPGVGVRRRSSPARRQTSPARRRLRPRTLSGVRPTGYCSRPCPNPRQPPARCRNERRNNAPARCWH